MPIFFPLLEVLELIHILCYFKFALNLQTPFLTPPMAMSAYYLKGVQKTAVELLEF
ncbi:MAG: hypothetical protein CM1200mP13_00020 [Candidatus Pelagibacterales bacterium]|nr:MAG: hypothetical protein CM1200mP13_00020 [Pelagibacterales bacterium]